MSPEPIDVRVLRNEDPDERKTRIAIKLVTLGIRAGVVTLVARRFGYRRSYGDWLLACFAVNGMLRANALNTWNWTYRHTPAQMRKRE